MKNHHATYIFFAILFALSSCAPATPALLPIETVFAATHSVILTQTARAKSAETATPLATNTLAPTPTPFPSATTVILDIVATSTPTVLPTITPTNITSGSGNVLYACELVSLSPKDGYVAKPNEKFKWIWRVTNIGTKKWQANATSAKYVRGTPFYKDKEVSLSKNTQVGDVGEFRIPMVAPHDPGTYTIVYSLKRGIHTFCYYDLTITVK